MLQYILCWGSDVTPLLLPPCRFQETSWSPSQRFHTQRCAKKTIQSWQLVAIASTEHIQPHGVLVSSFGFHTIPSRNTLKRTHITVLQKWSSNDHQMITFYINSDTLYKTHHHDLKRPRDLRKWCCRASSGANRSEGSGTKHPLRRCTNSFNLTSCGESPQGLRRKTISWKCVLFLLMISCKFVGFPMSRCFRRVFVGDIQESNHLNQII